MRNSGIRGPILPLLVMGGFFHVAHAQNDAVWLDALDLSKMSSGWQKPLANQSVDGKPLAVKGQAFAHGVGTHANSQIALNLFGAAKRFSALVGVDDEIGGKGRVSFEIYADGKRVASVGPLSGGEAAQPISADSTGIKQLILSVFDGDDGVEFDHADWGEAKIELAEGALTKPLAVDAPMIASVDDETPMPIFKASQISKKYSNQKSLRALEPISARAFQLFQP